MAQVRHSPIKRISPIKPGLTGARNWATAQIRAASYTRKGFMRLTLSIAALILFVVLMGLWLGGFLPDIRQSADDFKRERLIAMGFVVDRVDIMGEGRLNEAQVRQSLGVTHGDYMFDINMRSAQNRIESLSWVDHAVVRRLWPNRLVVQIVERRPYALWQNQGIVRVVDKNGKLIEDADVKSYAHLPLVVGAQAGEGAADLHQTLAEFPEIAKHVSAAVYVNAQRWDLQFETQSGQKIDIALPQEHIKGALATLWQLHADQEILARNISRIDMRLPDRIGLTPRKTHRA